jgi:hypothetical protein
VTVGEGLNLVKGLTRHGDGHPSAPTGNDTQLGADAFLIALFDHEIKQLRREITTEIPEYFTATLQTTLGAGVNVFAGLAATADFERILRIERTDDGGQTFWPVPCAEEPYVDQPDRLSWREQSNGTVYFTPKLLAPGTYLFTYNTQQTPDPVVSGTTIAVPRGCEMVIVHRVCALGRSRLEEEASYHEAKANKILYGDPNNRKDKGQIALLKRRTGVHPVSGFRAVRWGW